MDTQKETLITIKAYTWLAAERESKYGLNIFR